MGDPTSKLQSSLNPALLRTPRGSTWAAKPPPSPEPPFHPGEAIFSEDEETESFYVIVDLSGDDFTSTGRYRNGKVIRSGQPTEFQGNEEDYDNDNDNENEFEDRDLGEEGEDDDEDDEADEDDDDDEEEEDDDDEPSNVGTDRESTLQILDLHSYTPLINYEGRIYKCQWSVCNGTELIFLPPPSPSKHRTGNQDVDSNSEYDYDTKITPARNPYNSNNVSTSSSGRQIRNDVDHEAELLGSTVFRLEGFPAKVRPKGRDKALVASKAKTFAEKLDKTIAERISRMEERGEDTSWITMRKFSEGQ